MARVKVAKLSDLEDGAARRVEVGGSGIALVRIGDRVYALSDVCSHADASLSEGDVYADDLEIECPLHGSTFDLDTGDVTALPATEPVDTYSAVIDGDDVVLDL